MKRSYWPMIAGLFFLLLLVLIFRPITIPTSADQCKTTIGIVAKIFEGGPQDVTFRLKGDPSIYYINRGLEQGLQLEELQSLLTDKVVTLKYPKHWTPLDPKGINKHVCILEYEGKELYNEINLVHKKEG